MSKTETYSFGSGALYVFEDESIDFTRQNPAKPERPRAKKSARKSGPAKRTRKKGRKG